MAKRHDESYLRLVELLKQAAHFEHCLVNAYLYAACSMKTMPSEFETIGDSQDNIHAAIQFQFARTWKRSILLVAREEMLHLHYVQCMLRALGERPCLTLPDRDSTTGNWIIRNWLANNGEIKANTVQIAIEPLTMKTIKHFVLFESNDSLKDQSPFGPRIMGLLKKLFEFEVDYYIESSLLNVEDDENRKFLVQKLLKLYIIEHSLVTASDAASNLERASIMLDRSEELHFPSVADFYLNKVAPLYEQAFCNNWVVNNNRNLVNEFLSTDVAGEGFLPIGPVYRSKNFEKSHDKNIRSHYDDVKKVNTIIDEIVGEGEGVEHFDECAETLLTKVQQVGGARAYIKLHLKEKSAKKETFTEPEWLADCEKLRQSHLYKFAMIMMGLQQETNRASAVNLTFDACRQTVNLGTNITLLNLNEQLPRQFNSCYLVMIMWLSRMYESANWEVDRSRRQAIEMLASWPIMSLGIRPFLELASFFPIKKTELFLLEVDTLPCLPLNSRELLQLFSKEERSESINHQLDYFALETLTDVATWAANQITPINESELLAEQKEMIVTRLTALTALREFKAQFSFRIHGGYSNRKPDLTYQQEHPESERFEENPTNTVYKNAFVLRLRFSGWGLVQLATDPDPPSDEVGCTGIIMLQPSDGKKRRLNRALVWQRHINDLTEIVRGPSDVLPKIGVNCVDISLMVAGEDMKASCVPLHAPISPSAVDTSAVDKTLDITGLTELCRFKPADVTGDERRKVRIDLLEKAGFKPLLLGENHLIWQEGEPVDPFILAVLVDTSANEQEPDLAFSREIYNEGKRLIEMTPYERTLSARGPLGFEDKVTNVPTWAKQNFSKEEASFIGKPGYPTNYCIKRTQHLEQALRSVFMDADINLLKSEDVNTIVSLIDRMECITQNPKGRFTQWMTLLLHYAHTISGPLRSNDTNAILEMVRKKTGISCTIRAAEDRNETNARWLIKFCQGIMDVDALSDFVFGELYIPLTIIANQDQQVQLTHSWMFNEPMYHPLSSFALDFEHAFWRDDYIYGLVPNSRTLKIDDTQELLEKLAECGDGQLTDSAHGYVYCQTGIPDINKCVQSIKLDMKDANANLIWEIQFHAANEEAILSMSLFFANQTTLADVALRKFTQPFADD